LTQSTDKDIKIIRRNLDRLERALSCADENGLFKTVAKAPNKTVAKAPNFTDIISNMADAYRVLENKEIPAPERALQAWKKYRLANHQYYQAVNSAGSWWRFKYCFGGPFIVYFLVVLAFTFLAWLFFGSSISDSEVLWIPSWAYLWGLIGGILQGLWFLWQHVSDRKLRKAWFPWYLLLPFMGALLGALAYLLFFAGFISATGESEIQSKYFVILLSALAGFSTKWAVQMLDRLTTLIQIRK
jgi:hypothetical protein